MIELFLINVGAMVTMFCGYKFAITHLTKGYSGIFDLIVRGILIVGILSSSLLMPIWLQKSRLSDFNIGLFLVGAYLGIILATVTAWLEKKGRLKWPKEKEPNPRR